MINLLPPQYKEELRQEEKLRIALILGIVVISSLLCLILILVSVRFHISGQTESEKIIFEQEERKIKTPEIQELQEKITLTNQIFSQLNLFYQNKISFIEILERISKTLPSEVYLTTLSLNSLEGGTLDCSLFGFAPTREILFDFKKNLETEVTFKEIYFPPANWIEPTDIDFNVTFKITK